MGTPSRSMLDRDFNEKLIEEVQRRPVLYDPRESGYKDRFKVEEEWKAVAIGLGCTADSAKKRWHNLRGSYSRSRSSQNLPSGSGTAGVKKAPFYLAQQMSFLHPHMQHAPMVGNLGLSEPEPLCEEATGTGTRDTPDVATCTSSNSVKSSPPSTAAEESEIEGFTHYAPVIPDIPSTSAPSNKRRRPAPESAPDKDSVFKETVVRFLESRMMSQEMEEEKNDDLESLRGLLPHMAKLSLRKKRAFLRQTYDLVFQMLEEEEDEGTPIGNL